MTVGSGMFPVLWTAGRSDTRGGFVFRVSIEHEEIQVLCRHLACERVRTDQSIAVTAEPQNELEHWLSALGAVLNLPTLLVTEASS